MGVVDDIIRDLRNLASPENIERAGLDAFAEHQKRIFEDGRNADGGIIGKYSTDPLYVNPKNSPRTFSPKGKTGKTKFADGTPHVTRYFPTGYKGFRTAAGKVNPTVNLKLFGDLSRSYVPGFIGNKYCYGFISDKFDKIATGNEEHFRTSVFEASDQEVDIFIESLLEEL